MTRTVSCDVCGKADDIEALADYFYLEIPHKDLDGARGEALAVDICSPACLKTVAGSFDKEEPPQE